MPDLLDDRSLPGRWLRRWGERPPWPQLRDVDGRWFSSQELEERSRRGARGLLAAGLRPGDRLALCAESSASLVIAYLAALRAGLVVMPINPGYTPSEVSRLLRHARPAAVAVDDDARGRLITQSSDDELAVFGIELALPSRGAGPGIDLAGAEDGALLLYTSGTTGAPKGALLSHGNLLAGASAVELAWRWEPDDRLLLALPLFHLHGLGVGVNGSMCAGASLELRPRFDPADVASRAGGCSLFFGVPAMYHRLLSAGCLPSLRRLRLLVSGSAPLPATLARQVEHGAGQLPLERYGMTETVMLTSNPLEGERRPGTVGVPLPGVELRLGGSAEVEVRGPNVSRGYYENPAATAEAFTDDGWFRTGDVGEWDEAGYLKLVGRSKELIITGGLNVYPREVEEVLAEHPGVSEVAVVGRPSERWGEEVTAVVVAREAVCDQALRDFAAERLAAYKVPKRIEFTTALPRNAMGKLVRGEL